MIDHGEGRVCNGWVIRCFCAWMVLLNEFCQTTGFGFLFVLTSSGLHSGVMLKFCIISCFINLNM